MVTHNTVICDKRATNTLNPMLYVSVAAYTVLLAMCTCCITPAKSAVLFKTFDDPTPTNLDHFGVSVDMDASYIVIGEGNDDTIGDNVGQVHIYQRGAGSLVATFNDPTPTQGDRFGLAVSLDNGLVLIGAPNDDTHGKDVGQAYLFDIASGSLLQTFNDPTPTLRNGGRFADLFGFSVSLEGDLTVVGAFADDTIGTDVGQVHIFDTSSGVLLYTLNDPSPHNGDFFGQAIVIDGNRVLVGDPFDDTYGQDTGQVHLFDASSGELLRTFTSPTLAGQPQFGSSVDIQGDIVVIGAEGDDSQGVNVGQVYIYSAGTGELLQVLVDPTPAGSDQFGNSVAIDNNVVAVAAGTDRSTGNESGQAYLYDATTGNLLDIVNDPTPTNIDAFGQFSIALDGEQFLVGASGDDTYGPDRGQAYLFSIPEPSLGLIVIAAIQFLIGRRKSWRV